MVKDDVSCRDQLIHRLNWNMLSVDEIEQIKIHQVANKHHKINKRDTLVSRNGSQTCGTFSSYKQCHSPADPATTTHVGGKSTSDIHDIEARNTDM